MKTTYAQKNDIVQKASANTAKSVADSSSQSATLQRHATLANMVVQRDPESVNSSAQQSQTFGTIRFVALDEFYEAYKSEIDQTNTLSALVALNEFKKGDHAFGFTTDFGKCKVSRNPADKVINFIIVPDPKRDVDKRCEDVVNLSTRLDDDRIRRIFAIHELEHLRLFYKNSGMNLKRVDDKAGEPSMNPVIMSWFVPLKKDICNRLRDAIPKKLDKSLKKYIENRLDYIMKPKDSKLAIDSPENSTARELTTVLMELLKLCEFCNDRSLDLFKSRVRECYCSWQ